MRLGVVILPDAPWSTAQATWQRAEALGFDHAWTFDHIAWRELRDGPWFGAVPTLAAAATATSHIRLGTLVASPNFRHPVPFARDLLGLDDVSNGRLTLGIGAGGTGWDATVLGQDPWSPRERADRFAEFVTLTDRLLREPVTTFAGRFYSAHDAPMAPGCVQRPRIPFAVAATGRRGMEIVASFGQTWVTNGDRDHEGPPLDAQQGVRSIERQLRLLEDACEAAGRDPASVDRLVLADQRLASGIPSPERFRDTLGQYAAIGITDFVVHWPRAAEPFAGDLDAFERAVAG